MDLAGGIARRTDTLSDICKARLGLRVDEAVEAEELALEVLCSHPLHADGGQRRRQGTICLNGSQGEFLGEVRQGSDTDTESESQASTDPCGRSDSSCSDGVVGIWNVLGLKELKEPEREGGSESANSGGSAYHDLYNEVLEGYVMEMGTSNA